MPVVTRSQALAPPPAVQLEDIEQELDPRENHQQESSEERRRALRLIGEPTLPFHANANRARLLLFQAGSLQAHNARARAIKHEE